MKNKRAKQMIVDITLKGRKAIWHGDESEVFAAIDLNQLNDEFGVEGFPDNNRNIVSNRFQYWWLPCVDEDGNILPLICGVYGGACDIAQVTTSYN